MQHGSLQDMNRWTRGETGAWGSYDLGHMQRVVDVGCSLVVLPDLVGVGYGSKVRRFEEEERVRGA